MLVSSGDSVQMLRGRICKSAGGYAVLVVVVLITGGNCVASIEGITHIPSAAGPVDGLGGCRNPVSATIVVIDYERKATSWRVSDDRIPKLPPTCIKVILLRASHVVLRDTEFPVRIPVKAGAIGLSAVVIYYVVPAVYEKAAHRIPVTNRVFGA